MARVTLRLLVASILPLMASCLVEETCYQGDCPAGLRCIDNACKLECTTDADCQLNAMDIGKRCVDNRCRFTLGDRPPAPPLCLEVANPKSGIAGQTRCIADDRGKVVMLFFALLA